MGWLGLDKHTHVGGVSGGYGEVLRSPRCEVNVTYSPAIPLASSGLWSGSNLVCIEKYIRHRRMVGGIG